MSQKWFRFCSPKPWVDSHKWIFCLFPFLQRFPTSCCGRICQTYQINSVNVNYTEQLKKFLVQQIMTYYIVMFLNISFQLLFLFPLRRTIFLNSPIFVDLSLIKQCKSVTTPLLEISLFRLMLVDL